MNNNQSNDNLFYVQFKNEDVNDSILEAKPSSFEDHFWHMLCLSIYYKHNNDPYLEKVCLQKACDLNYAYSAMIYFDSKGVLNQKYKQYIEPFCNQMKDPKVEERIKYYNKKNAKSKNLGFLWYSLISLLVIPVMLILVFLFKLDTTMAAIIAIIAMFIAQFIFQNYQKKVKFKRNSRKVERKLENYLKYYDRFAYLFQNELYIDLIKAKAGSDNEKEIIEKIKRGESK